MKSEMVVQMENYYYYKSCIQQKQLRLEEDEYETKNEKNDRRQDMTGTQIHKQCHHVVFIRFSTPKYDLILFIYIPLFRMVVFFFLFVRLLLVVSSFQAETRNKKRIFLLSYRKAEHSGKASSNNCQTLWDRLEREKLRRLTVELVFILLLVPCVFDVLFLLFYSFILKSN